MVEAISKSLLAGLRAHHQPMASSMSSQSFWQGTSPAYTTVLKKWHSLLRQAIALLALVFKDWNNFFKDPKQFCISAASFQIFFTFHPDVFDRNWPILACKLRCKSTYFVPYFSLISDWQNVSHLIWRVAGSDSDHNHSSVSLIVNGTEIIMFSIDTVRAEQDKYYSTVFHLRLGWFSFFCVHIPLRNILLKLSCIFHLSHLNEIPACFLNIWARYSN